MALALARFAYAKQTKAEKGSTLRQLAPLPAKRPPRRSSLQMLRNVLTTCTCPVVLVCGRQERRKGKVTNLGANSYSSGTEPRNTVLPSLRAIPQPSPYDSLSPSLHLSLPLYSSPLLLLEQSILSWNKNRLYHARCQQKCIPHFRGKLGRKSRMYILELGS